MGKQVAAGFAKTARELAFIYKISGKAGDH